MSSNWLRKDKVRALAALLLASSTAVNRGSVPARIGYAGLKSGRTPRRDRSRVLVCKHANRQRATRSSMLDEYRTLVDSVAGFAFKVVDWARLELPRLPEEH